MAHIYLLQEHGTADVYKIGRSTQFEKRIKQYHAPKVFRLWKVAPHKINKIEYAIICRFGQKYQRTKGREWFIGDPNEMADDCNELVKAFEMLSDLTVQDFAKRLQSTRFYGSNLKFFGEHRDAFRLDGACWQSVEDRQLATEIHHKLFTFYTDELHKQQQAFTPEEIVAIQDVVKQLERNEFQHEILQKLETDLFEEGPLPAVQTNVPTRNATNMEELRSAIRHLSGYHHKKQVFERYCCLIVNEPDCPFVVFDGPRRQYVAKPEILDLFRDVDSGKRNQPFLQRWFLDPTIRSYQKVVFLPEFSLQEVPTATESNCFNLFHYSHIPHVASASSCPQQQERFKHWLNIGLGLCGGDQPRFDYFLRFVADILQNPRRRFPFPIAFVGGAVAGKKCFFNAIGELLQRAQFAQFGNGTDLFGKLLVVEDDFTSSSLDGIAHTADCFQHSQLMLQKSNNPLQWIDNFARLVVFFENAFPKHWNEGSWIVFRPSLPTTFCLPESAYHDVEEHYQTKEFRSYLLEQLLSLDLSGLDLHHRPVFSVSSATENTPLSSAATVMEPPQPAVAPPTHATQLQLDISYINKCIAQREKRIKRSREYNEAHREELRQKSLQNFHKIKADTVRYDVYKERKRLKYHEKNALKKNNKQETAQG